MGLYFEYIYPGLMEKALNRQSINDLRKTILSKVKGDVLEIGFGTGLNLAHYPELVSNITAIDTVVHMSEKVKGRIECSSKTIIFETMSAENLSFEDNKFDSVVSTFTFCSITDTEKAISEIYRVLKPGGRLLFLEHGINPDKKVNRMQNFINPVFKVISCSLNRDIIQIINMQRFDIIEMNQFYQHDFIKIVDWLYMGVAIKC